MILEIDDIIPVSKRHKGETIRQILRYDSGYIKDLFLKDKSICFSEDCMKEMGRLTRNCHDNWEKPNVKGTNVFNLQKLYASPYQFDFNDVGLINENIKRLKTQ